jgi:hypothetical protein
MIFNDWINTKFIEWRGNTRNTVTGFAKYIRVSQQVMSIGMNPNGKVPKGPKSISSLVALFGNEVYEVLGLPIHESDSLLEGLPKEVRASLTPAL